MTVDVALVNSIRDFKGNRKLLGSGGSMAARLKLKGIDGRAPPGVEPAAKFDSTRGNSPGPGVIRIDNLKAFS